MTKRLGLLAICLALAVIGVGCSDANTNTNANNMNNANANANMNANKANMNANANANANANREMTREDVNKKKDDYLAEAKKLGRKIGTGADDTWLWVKTRSALAAADDLRDSTINVDVANGVITLTGTVASADQMKKADMLAKGIDGQKGVQNKLKVAAPAANAKTNANVNNKNSNKK